MKILISGGTGLVGKELGKKLVAKGHEVVVLSRNPERTKRDCPFPHSSASWDDLEASDKLSDIQAVVHLAGANVSERRWSSSFKDKIYRSRVETTKSLVAWANRQENLKAFVSASAIGIYKALGKDWISEDSPRGDDFLAGVCKDWEAPLKDLTAARAVSLRVGVVISEKGGALEKMLLPFQLGIGGTIAGGSQYMSWIDIEDLSSMFVFALETNIEGAYSAVAPKPCTNKELSQALAKRLSKGLGPNLPYFALRIMVGEMAAHIVANQRISASKIQQAGFEFKYKTIDESVVARVPKLKGLTQRRIFEQWVPYTKEEIFPFFSEAKNLQKITPDDLGFNIIKMSTDQMGSGTEIDYKLKIYGLPFSWKTKILDWQPPHMFSDNQEKGPYSKWYHIHKFEKLGDGTLMTDQVDYCLPMGAPGYALTSWRVSADVNRIFSFRKKIISKLFS